MGWIACIHGRAVASTPDTIPVQRPTCSDCEELAELREFESTIRVKNHWVCDDDVKEHLSTLDRIRAARDTDRAPPPDALPGCLCGSGTLCPLCYLERRT